MTKKTAAPKVSAAMKQANKQIEDSLIERSTEKLVDLKNDLLAAREMARKLESKIVKEQEELAIKLAEI